MKNCSKSLHDRVAKLQGFDLTTSVHFWPIGVINIQQILSSSSLARSDHDRHMHLPAITTLFGNLRIAPT